MSNPELGFNELSAGQAQPEVTVNAGDRAITKALAGEIVINFPSDANLTLQATNPPASGDNWAAATLRFTDNDNVLTAARDVIYPNVDSLYGGSSRARFEVVNGTARTLTIKRSGQTGVAIPAGNSALVRHDGTDIVQVAASGGGGGAAGPRVLQVAASQHGQPITAGTGAAYLRAPYAFNLAEVRASLLTPHATGTFTVDINVNGSSILSTKLTIDATEKTSTTASVPAVISVPSVADDDEITIDIDDDGDGAAEGLIVTLIGDAP